MYRPSWITSSSACNRILSIAQLVIVSHLWSCASSWATFKLTCNQSLSLVLLVINALFLVLLIAVSCFRSYLSSMSIFSPACNRELFLVLLTVWLWSIFGPFCTVIERCFQSRLSSWVVVVLIVLQSCVSLLMFVIASDSESCLWSKPFYTSASHQSICLVLFVAVSYLWF